MTHSLRQSALYCLLCAAIALAACANPPPPATPTPDPPLVPCTNPAAPAARDTLTGLPGLLYFLVNNDVVALAGSPLAEHTIVSLSTDDYMLAGVSPTGKWLLYGAFRPPGGNPNPLTLRSVQGEVLTRTFTAVRPPPDGGWVYTGWITDTLLLVHRYDSTLEGGFPYMVGLYDPAADSWRTSLLDELPDRAFRGAVAISPDLTRVAYVVVGDGQHSLVLWDLTQHQEIWRRADFHTGSIIQGTRVGHFPLVWSRDSSRVAFSDWGSPANKFQGQVIVLDRDGQEARALATTRPGDLLSGLAWSPDGRYLAGITLVRDRSPRNIIIVYDLANGIGVDLCSLPESDSPLNNILASGVVWSPDSQFISYGVGPDSLSEANGTVVQHVHTGARTLVQLGPRIQLLGWTAATP